MQRNEKLGMILAAGLIALLLGAFVVAGELSAPRVRAAGQSLGCDDSGKYLPTSASTTSNYLSPCGPAATTTPIFLGIAAGNNATTTVLTTYIPNAQAFDINLFNVASVTQSSVVNYTIWFSNNNNDWYQQGAQNVVAGVNTVSNEAYTWVPGATTTARLYPTISTRISSSGEKYVQVRASASVGTTSIYAQIIPDNAIPN